MSADWPWRVLDLDGPADERAVKRAYAARLKAIDRTDTEQLQQLRSAFDRARKLSATRPKPGLRQRPKMVEIAANEPVPKKSIRRPPRTRFEAPQASSTESVPIGRQPVKAEPPATERPFTPSSQETHQPAQKMSLQFPSAATSKSAPTARRVRLDEKTPTAKAHNQSLSTETWGNITLRDAQDTLHGILGDRRTLRATEIAALRDLFAQAETMHRSDFARFERALAQTLITNEIKVTRDLAIILDDTFEWVSDVSHAQRRIFPLRDGQKLIVDVTQAIAPKKPFPLNMIWPTRTRGQASAPNTILDITRLYAILVATANAIGQTAIAYSTRAEMALIAEFLIVAGLTYAGIIVLAIVLEGVWLLMYPLRAIGLDWLLQRVYDIVFSHRLKRWIVLRSPEPRAVSILVAASLLLPMFANAMINAFSRGF